MSLIETLSGIFGGSNAMQASFRGVEFFIETENDDEFGRRLAEHDYPNKTARYGEDTGGFAGRFKVSGFVAGTSAFDDFQMLRAACNEVGTGELILTMLGSYTVKCGKCNATATPSETLEKITFDLEFVVSDEEPEVSVDEVSGLGCFNLGDSVFGQLEAFASENLGFLKTDIVTSLMRGDLLGVVDGLLGMTGFLDKGDVSKFMRAIKAIQGGVYQLMNGGQFELAKLLFGSEFGAWRMLMRGAHANNGSQAALKAAYVATNFGSQLSVDPAKMPYTPTESNTSSNQKTLWSETTQNRAERNMQRQLLIDLHKVAALTVGYVTLANIEFETSEQARQMRDAIELAYLSAVHGQTNIDNGARVASPVVVKNAILHHDRDVRDAFEQMRTYALKVLDSASNVTFKVRDYKLAGWQETSVLNLAYLSQAEWIGNDEERLLDLAVKLSDENGGDIFKCSGQVKILAVA